MGVIFIVIVSIELLENRDGKRFGPPPATPKIKGTVYVLYFISFSYFSKMEMGRNIFMVLFYQTGKKFTAIKAVSGRVKLKFVSPSCCR